MKYRKKPVVIEAWRNGSNEPRPAWIYAAFMAGVIASADDGTLQIQTLEGVMTADIGDYVIQGVKGEIYPCKPDIFPLTYEAAE